MNTNGHLNGSRNGNGAHGLNGSLNGNGAGHAKTKRSRLKNWIMDFRYSNAPYIILGICFWATLLGGGALYGHYHPQPQAPIDPRTERIKKNIETLYDTIDVLKDELPDDPDENDHANPYLQ